jgi:hypothetical protein
MSQETQVADGASLKAARAHCPRAIEVLAELMNNPKATASARAFAAERILDRGYGKPPQTNTVVATALRAAAEMTDDELALPQASSSAARGSKINRLVRSHT